MNADPSLTQALQVLERLQQQAEERVRKLQAEGEAARRDLHYAIQAVESLRYMLGEMPAPEQGEPPLEELVPPEVKTVEPVQRNGSRPKLRGEAAVAALLMETPGKHLPNRSLTEELTRRGWGPPPESKEPEAAVRAAANRLRKKRPDEFFLEADGFVYRPPDPARTIFGEADA